MLAIADVNEPHGFVEPVSVPEDNKNVALDVASDGIPSQQLGEPLLHIADANGERGPSNQMEVLVKETKKRVRRVGRTPTRKIPKLEEKIPLPMDIAIGDNNAPDNVHVAAAAAAAMDAATAAIGAVSEVGAVVAMDSSSAMANVLSPANQGVLSKHDEKWHSMFQKLMEFKERNKHTLVPQCYSEDPR